MNLIRNISSDIMRTPIRKNLNKIEIPHRPDAAAVAQIAVEAHLAPFSGMSTRN